VRGREWYQSPDVAARYDDRRFSRGGRVIDARERRAVRDALGPVEGRRVLEIACGTGRFGVALAERGASVVGLDVSPAMLARARDRARDAGVADRVAFVRGDAAALPFPDDAFDAVVAVRFLHLAATPGRFLAELARVSRDRVFVDTFDRRSLREAYTDLLPMGSRLYGAREVRRLLADAGLRLAGVERDFVVPFGAYRLLPTTLARALRRLDRAVGRTAPGRRLASVSYWDARVADPAVDGDANAGTGGDARADLGVPGRDSGPDPADPAAPADSTDPTDPGGGGDREPRGGPTGAE
jgi:ubiquinone/menaquinone biosynthesis C-methylase UbiE